MTVCSVIVFIGGRLTGKFVLEEYRKNVVSFGRSDECDIVIRNQLVSGCHGCFYKEKGAWYVQDMQSRNGIHVDDRKVTGEPLIPGKKYILDGKGEVFFGVHMDQRVESHTDSQVVTRGKSHVESLTISGRGIESSISAGSEDYKKSVEFRNDKISDAEPVAHENSEKAATTVPSKNYKAVGVPGGDSVKKNLTVDGKRVCPKCGGTNCQILSETNTKGKDFGAGKGCLGYICFGPIGIICGTCGKGKQMKTTNFWYCPDCGNRFKL